MHRASSHRQYNRHDISHCSVVVGKKKINLVLFVPVKSRTKRSRAEQHVSALAQHSRIQWVLICQACSHFHYNIKTSTQSLIFFTNKSEDTLLPFPVSFSFCPLVSHLRVSPVWFSPSCRVSPSVLPCLSSKLVFSCSSCVSWYL